MKNKYFLFLFFTFCCYLIVNGQESVKDSIYISKSIQKIKELSALKEYDKVIALSRGIIKVRKNKKALANDYYRLGFYFKKKNQIDSTYYYYLKSYKGYKNIKDTLKIAKQLFHITKLESDQELYNKSDSSAILVLKYSKKGAPLLGSVYNCLGINSKNKKEYKEALKWYRLAIITTKDSIKKLRYLNNEASTYIDLKKYDKAFLYLKKIKKSKYYDNVPLKLKAKIIDNHAFAKFLCKQEVNVSEFLKAQEIKEQIKDYTGLIANYANLSDYFKEKNSKIALDYAYKMHHLSKKIALPKDRIEALDKIISLEEGFKLRKYAKERNRLSDSIQLVKQRSQNKFAKIIYNYEEEEKQKLKAQVALVKQKSQKLTILLVSGVLVFILLFYLFYKNQKTKKEKIIEVYNTETRLAKKIHDVLANDLYLVMNKVQKETNTNPALLQDLEKIYDLTRNISHENSPVLTGEKFELFLKQLLIEFSTNDTKVINKGLTNINVNSLEKEKQIILYRVLQELLVNMQKHSKAKLVVIKFTELHNVIYVNYKDNGVGTSLKVIKSGLQNMETRMKSIKGFINFESEEGKGFKANIKFKR